MGYFHSAVSPSWCLLQMRFSSLILFTAFDRLHYDRQSFVLPPMYVLAVIEEIATTHSMEYSGGSSGLHWFPRKPPFKSDELFAY